MVDSRAKGARGENVVKKLLIQATELNWQRVPMSGALHDHGLVGDLYIPDKKNTFTIEVKNYKDDKLTTKILTDNMSQIHKWWAQSIEESEMIDREPLLFFKHDRSKVFVATSRKPTYTKSYLYISDLDIYIMIAEVWLLNEEIEFVREN